VTRLTVPELVLVAIIAPLSAATAPCCYVTAIDSHTGLVTAKENVSGRPFQFKPIDSSQIRALHVGSPVYADFGTRQVSLDGQTACCNMLDIPSTPPMPAEERRPPAAP
jgi:hypothetical protein